MPLPRRALIITAALLLATVASLAREASADSWYFRTILHDDFSSREAGILPVTANDRYQFSYEGGEYVVRRLDTAVGMLTPPLLQSTHADAVMAVDVRFPDNVALEAAGLWCRRAVTANEPQTGYRLVIDPYNRFIRLTRADTDGMVELASGRSAAFTSGTAWNRIALSCVGSTITVTINGVRVAGVEDTTYRSGYLALITNVFAGAPTTTYEIHFDNLDVSVPTDLPYHLTVPPNVSVGETP